LYLIKSPNIFNFITGKSVIWRFPPCKKRIFLTFDDGPIPEVTPWVIEILKKYDAKATFFCVGENVKKFPEVYKLIIENNHSVGNHTFNHLKGWKTNNIDYIGNIKKSSEIIKSNLFRPPYGKISYSQLNLIKNDFYTVLWTVLSGDFDTEIDGKQCFENVVSYAKDGYIIVFHDSIKAKERLVYALPKVIEHYLKLGYTFESIDINKINEIKKWR